MERKKKPRANTISAMVAAAGGDPKDHYVDENSWLEVIDYAKNLGVTPKEIFDYTQKTKGNTYKTKTSTMRIGCLIYDTLKKKSKLSTRSRRIKTDPWGHELVRVKQVWTLRCNVPDSYSGVIGSH